MDPVVVGSHYQVNYRVCSKETVVLCHPCPMKSQLKSGMISGQVNNTKDYDFADE